MGRKSIWLLAAAVAAVCAFCVWNAPERQISRRLAKAFVLLEKDAGENPVVAAGKAARLQNFLAEEIVAGSRRYGIEETFPRQEFVRRFFAARAEFAELSVASGKPRLAFPAKGVAEGETVVLAGGENPWWTENPQRCRLGMRFGKTARKWRLEAIDVSFGGE